MEYQPYENDIFYDPYGMRIWEQRHALCCEILEKYQITKVFDLGCASGKLLKRLTFSTQFTNIVRKQTFLFYQKEGIDIDASELESALQTVQPEGYHYLQKCERSQPLAVKLWNGDVTKLYKQFKNYNSYAVTAIELIEHLPKKQLPFLENNIFGFIRPQLVIISTPNYDFNYWFHNGIQEEQKNENQSNDKWGFRHLDHKFEFTQEEFHEWANNIVKQYGWLQNYQNQHFLDYIVEFEGVGTHKSKSLNRGYCSQFAIFIKASKNSADKENITIGSNNELETPIKKVKTQQKQMQYDISEFRIIEYPFEKIEAQFVHEIKYAFFFMYTYNYQQENYDNQHIFIPFEQLNSISSMKQLTNGDINKFKELLSKIDLQEAKIIVDQEKGICVPEMINQYSSSEEDNDYEEVNEVKEADQWETFN